MNNMLPQGRAEGSKEPTKQGLRKIRGTTGEGLGQGIAIRHDWGSQYTSALISQKFFGLKNSPAFVHEPQTNGVIERFFKTLKMECLWLEDFQDVDHARQIVGRCMELYNTQCLIERHGHRTPVSSGRPISPSTLLPVDRPGMEDIVQAVR